MSAVQLEAAATVGCLVVVVVLGIIVKTSVAAGLPAIRSGELPVWTFQVSQTIRACVKVLICGRMYAAIFAEGGPETQLEGSLQNQEYQSSSSRIVAYVSHCQDLPCEHCCKRWQTALLHESFLSTCTAALPDHTADCCITRPAAAMSPCIDDTLLCQGTPTNIWRLTLQPEYLLSQMPMTQDSVHACVMQSWCWSRSPGLLC